MASPVCVRVDRAPKAAAAAAAERVPTVIATPACGASFQSLLLALIECAPTRLALSSLARPGGCCAGKRVKGVHEQGEVAVGGEIIAAGAGNRHCSMPTANHAQGCQKSKRAVETASAGS